MSKPTSPFDAKSIVDTLTEIKNAANTITLNACDIYSSSIEEYRQIPTYRIFEFFCSTDKAVTSMLNYMRSALNTQHYGETNQLISAMLTHLSALILASTDLLTCIDEEYGRKNSDNAEIIGHARPDEQALPLLTRALPKLDTIARKILTVSEDVVVNTPEDNQWKEHPYNNTHPFKTLDDLPNTNEKENTEE